MLLGRGPELKQIGRLVADGVAATRSITTS
jgi:hypothetical protein